MFALSRIAILVCVSAFLANICIVYASDYQFVYMDDSGPHYLQSSAEYFHDHPHGHGGHGRGGHGQGGHGQGGHGQGHGSRPHHHMRPPRPPGLVHQLLEHHAQQFCSTFLHIVPYATTTSVTQTSTTSETLVTQTATTTITSNPGTSTVPATVTQSSTTTETDTTTDTETDTSTSTSTSTTTTTTFSFTAPNNDISRRHQDNIPPWLRSFPSSQISSACSRIVTPHTDIVSTTTTTIVPLTASTTTTTTTVLPEVTDTTTTTATTTETDFTTETDTTTTVTTTTTSTTATATSTQCAQFFNVDGGGVDSTGTLTPFTNIQSAEGCCEFCWSGSTGCGLWFFFPGFGCFVVNDADGPNPTTQCPTGSGDYVVIPASGFDGNLGGEGPCNGASVN